LRNRRCWLLLLLVVLLLSRYVLVLVLWGCVD